MTQRFGPLATVLLLIVLTTGSAAAAVPVARVLETKGKVMVQAADKAGQPREAAALDTVYKGEKVILVAGSSAVLAFRSDGHIERLAKPGQVTAGKDGCVPKSAVEVVESPPRQKKAVGAAVMSLRAKGTAGVSIVREVPRRGPPPVPPHPISGSTILTLCPNFTWPAVPGAAYYRFKLESGPKVIDSLATHGPALALGGTPGHSPLTPGAAYDWEVYAVLADRTAKYACGGSFTTATKEQQARATDLGTLVAGKDVAYLTLAAVWFEENGMVAEATGAYERLSVLRPATAAYWFALSRLYQQADRIPDALEAYAKARQLQPLPAKPPCPEWMDKD